MGSTGPIVTYSWSFGDGSTAAGASVTHAYSNAGTYTATLTVSGSSGQQSTDTAIVTVTAPRAAHIVINEVEMNPQGEDSGAEWVELYNGTGASVNLSGWGIQRTAYSSEWKDLPAITLAPGEYYVLTFSVRFLANDGRAVRLRNAQGAIVDETPALADERDDGYTWQRIPNGADIDSLSDWQFRSNTRSGPNG
jgi:PKD repeat protein